MTKRTPRRRISSRTKQRCRIIKKFICKALGTASNPASQIKSKTHCSIKLSISDLEQKISDIETQLDKISKHCHDLTYLENNFNAYQNKVTLNENLDGIDKQSRNDLSSHETELLYKATNSRYKKTDESDSALKVHIKNNMTMRNENLIQNDLESQHVSKHTIKKNYDVRQPRDEEYYRHKKLAALYLANISHTPKDRQNINKAEYSTHIRKLSKKEHQKPTIIMDEKYGNLNKNDVFTFDNKRKKPRNKESSRRKYTELDQEFITDIIKKQYKPVKLFGRRESDFTQFSAPVCRDREFSIRNKICLDNDLCSCCFDQCRKHDYKNIISSDVSDMRSVCDARLYSSKKHSRYGHVKALDDYNNSEYYDLVPVKEKSSPKSRKKLAENVTIARHNYKEVPPSPRTQRPRLNLKAKVYDECDEINHIKKCSSTHANPKNGIWIESDSSSEILTKNNKNNIKDRQQQKPKHLFDNVGKFDNETNDFINNDTILNKQNTDGSTDKTLGEIKDLLQSFLTVIKKDSIHNENDINLSKNNGNLTSELQDTSKLYTNTPQTFNNYSVGNVPSPIMPVFPNTCCYPLMPIYPVNYLQNGHLFPSGSNTGNTCSKTTKQPKKSLSTCNYKQDEGNTSKDTQELIKEIYEIVTRSPKSLKKKQCSASYNECSRNKFTKNKTRSVGNSSAASKYNQNLGTSMTRCISKSCEAIGSVRQSFKYNSTASYSETVLEGLSVEATHSATEFEFDSYGNKNQTRENRLNILKDILKPWKWGKKKKDVIEELAESESTIEVNMQRKKPPFRQDFMNYAMHSQEFYDPPPLNQGRFCNPADFPNKQHYPNFCNQPYPNKQRDPSFCNPQGYPNTHPSYNQYPRFSSSYNHDNLLSPPHQGYDPRYHNIPQVPLCLKEIEVKSMGTQSERKMSLFKKLTQKVKVQQDASQQYSKAPAKAKSGIFNWKSFQENAKTGMDPKQFSLKTQQKLAQGDNKMRTAMIKKLFHKRNPFSPRNLIVRTLLGNDPSSFGNPPKMVKPRLFV